MSSSRVFWSAVGCMAAVLALAGVIAVLTTEVPSAANTNRARREYAPIPDALKNVTEPVYDYIVVGSGPGGGVVSSSLARQGFKVLLLEAGKNTTNNTIYTIPLNHGKSVEDHFSALNYDAQFSANRTKVLYPRAQGLGGCTLHHALITSPLPSSEDFEFIRNETGDDSWTTDNLHEIWRNMINVSYSPRYNNPCKHGYNGWLGISQVNLFVPPQELDPTATLPMLSLVNLTRKLNDYLDPNCAENRDDEGLHIIAKSTFNGTRVGSHTFVTKTQIEYPDNLHVKLDSLVTKVLFDETQTPPVAIGVEVHEGENLFLVSPNNKGNPYKVVRYYARREVILSGGTFETPKLLMLSGIGPAKELSKHNIDLLVNLPGVGQNMQDRYEIALTMNTSRQFNFICRELPEYCHKRWEDIKEYSILSLNGPVLGVKYKTNFTTAIKGPDMYFFTAAGYFKGYASGWSKDERLRLLNDRFTMLALKGWSQNRAGVVTLNSTDPHAQANLNFNQFAMGAEQDMPALIHAFKVLRNLSHTETARISKESGLPESLLKTELDPGIDVDTDAEIEDYIRRTVWGHHACCSAKIGNTKKDPMAVLDSRFRVKGVNNLRVVDASAFPRIPGFFITVPLYQLAGKGGIVIGEDADDACKKNPWCVPKDDNKALLVKILVPIFVGGSVLLVIIFLLVRRNRTQKANISERRETLTKAVDTAYLAPPVAETKAPAPVPVENGHKLNGNGYVAGKKIVQETTFDIFPTDSTPKPSANRFAGRSISIRRPTHKMTDAERRFFDLMDANKDGLISFDEFFHALNKQMPAGKGAISREDALDMFREIDTDEEQGFLSLAEWLAARGKHSGPKKYQGLDLSFEGVCCYYDDKKAGRRQVLHNISGYIPAGSFVALMGPSGAGKSTLLDIFAMRKSTGAVTGSILVNGEPRTRSFMRDIAYVLQEDLFLPNQTVFECVMYYANLRLPSSVSKEEKTRRVLALIKDMGLEKQKDSKVGGPLPGGINVRGLSGGQKRRLSMACGLISEPKILFLDEPTSGLDSFSALSVMETMRRLSREGITIICTIHQPRSTIWQLFDKLLLTAQGRLMYLGNADKVVHWFQTLGYKFDGQSNPADWVIDLVTTNFEKSPELFGSNTMRTEEDVEKASIKFADSDSFSKTRIEEHWAVFHRAIGKSTEGGSTPKAKRKQLAVMKLFAGGEGKFVTSWWTQYGILLERSYLSYVRNPGNVLARVFLVLMTGLLTGGANFNMENTMDNIVSRAGILYFICIIYVLLPFANLSLFIYDRQFYSKEAAAKLYAPSAYYISAMTVETLFNCINVLVSSTISYFMLDLGNSFADRGEQYGVFVGIVILIHVVGSQWVQLCGLSMPNQDVAFALGAAYVVAAQLFAGFLTSSDNFSWLGFIQWIDFLKYAWNALVRNEFAVLDDNMDDRVSVLDFLKVNAPQEIYQSALSLLAFWFVFNVFGYISLKYLHKERR